MLINIVSLVIDCSNCFKSTNPFSSQLRYVTLNKPDSNYNIHSIASLKDKEVYTVGTSYINTYLSSKGVNTKVYKELKKILDERIIKD